MTWQEEDEGIRIWRWRSIEHYRKGKAEVVAPSLEEFSFRCSVPSSGLSEK